MSNDAADEEVAKPRLSRRKKMMLVVGAVLILVLAGGFYWYRVNAARDFVKDGWHQLIVATESADRDLKADPTAERLAQVREDLEGTDAAVENLQYEADSRSTALTDAKALRVYKDFLQSYDEYLSSGVTVATDINKATQSDLDELKKKADAAKQSSENLKAELKFVQDSFPPTVFDLPTYAGEVQKQTVAAKSSQQQAADKETADKKQVEDNLNNFMQGFQSADTTRMKRYMTDDFVREYNFDAINAENRKYSKPTSYRITEITKDGSHYKTTVNITNTNSYPGSPTDTYTYTQKYQFVFDTKYNKWLIDNESN